ncbi:hypothetical protein [Desulfopila aestuarii]|uniref:DUF922 domain-containing protein n=1 Tax=Desulfopila aestuarii DSM 18488 TaxID=1121416 RepID=A0A1M7YLD5_9BACT|nr:hypothetical protein [Desulfopila aestuarii]SHO53440.1 hypothetical protein SAMN02745220_05120 [Desulfopila aestuarii DSM 18488]
MLKRVGQLVYMTVLVVVIQLAGCARLPEYARPQFSDSSERAGAGQGFSYRPLTVSDFQATSLPDPYVQYDHRIQARSCITLRSSANTAARISRGQIDGNVVYIGRFSQITFEAEFNPFCSWWSPEVRSERVGYVLQHEQIHFALTEITARRLNRDKSLEILQFMAIGSDPKEVGVQLQEKVKEVSREAMTEDIAVHTSFDEDTSLYFDPVAQQEWFDKISRELLLLKTVSRHHSTIGAMSVEQAGTDGG